LESYLVNFVHIKRNASLENVRFSALLIQGVSVFNLMSLAKLMMFVIEDCIAIFHQRMQKMVIAYFKRILGR
jgi:hypothetical protein